MIINIFLCYLLTHIGVDPIFLYSLKHLLSLRIIIFVCSVCNQIFNNCICQDTIPQNLTKFHLVEGGETRVISSYNLSCISVNKVKIPGLSSDLLRAARGIAS